MPVENSKKLAGVERLDLINRVINIRNINPEFDRDDLYQMLEELGFARANRSLFRLWKEIIDLEKGGAKGWHIDQEIDFLRSDILSSDEVGLESRFLPLIRSTVNWYNFNFGLEAKHQFPRSLSYRWLKWANYFLQSVNPAQSNIQEIDIFVVGQLYAMRDLAKAIGHKTTFKDLEAWLTARPWESEHQTNIYLKMIEAKAYLPLLRVNYPNDPNMTIEKVGVTYIADAMLNVCSLDGIKDLPESQTWKLPHQQKDIYVKWCRENKQPAGLAIKIQGIEEPLTIGFE